MSDSILLQAFKGKNTQVPVWFMRQAGRYLPAYQDMRKKHSLDEMFNTPELASHVTCLPVGLLNVDAAILFADILTLPSKMGFDIRFDPKHGPVIDNPIRHVNDTKRIHLGDKFSNIEKTIRLTIPRLPKDVPLIGFAGAPFTVLCYLLEGGSSNGFQKALSFAYAQPKTFLKLMDILTKGTIEYLKVQKKAGIHVFQLFDTWGGILPAKEFKDWSLPCVQRIFESVDLPSIYYLKNCAHLLSLMEKCGADYLSVGEDVDLGRHPVLRKTHKGIQGNLQNTILYENYDVIEAAVLKLLAAAKKRYKKYIFNLSHGILPDMSMDKVRFVTEVVHGFPWRGGV